MIIDMRFVYYFVNCDSLRYRLWWVFKFVNYILRENSRKEFAILREDTLRVRVRVRSRSRVICSLFNHLFCKCSTDLIIIIIIIIILFV